mmetsp:Transcript_141675/g.272070  ORF Transcript_141675/g.272070 Transcript_141675/m.272070 type:complete len:93 (-) Transcript_141675:1383-1661(-)
MSFCRIENIVAILRWRGRTKKISRGGCSYRTNLKLFDMKDHAKMGGRLKKACFALMCKKLVWLPQALKKFRFFSHQPSMPAQKTSKSCGGAW